MIAELVDTRPVETRPRTAAGWRTTGHRLNFVRPNQTPPPAAAKWDAADCAAVVREANKIRAKGRPRVMGIGKCSK